ncbi:helix-turn-helix domain-containing protein [Streptomyces poriferorum]|uniref:helix-turn-helix transcriptional regulator n=1 Tax=Streptomyces poriferorum TaxID=2798799 RepID=UPI00273FA200|nr:helix-turn-helix domain-containing protein [Streptomyces sp. Alt1]WLQ49084.1 helix-turn-helix domain-containing protein [Streptomyces sp. Alt1]
MSSEDAALEALVALGDPVRRGLYRHVSGTPGEVGRDAAAEAVGVSRSLAAFHLDKLVEAGLLEVGFRRLSGRSGPGSGRPSKLYRRAEGERTVSVPPRSYDTASRLLAEVVERAGLDGELQAAARAAGEASGGEPGCEADPVEVLRARGYEPFWDEGTLRLNNCPFHALADQFPALVCGMNLAGIEGLLKGLPGGQDWSAAMDPLPHGCCVALETAKRTGPGAEPEAAAGAPPSHAEP